MADLPISSAAALTGTTLATGDLFPVLDISAASGSKGSKITAAELFTGRTLAGTVAMGFRDTSAAFDVTQTFTSSTALNGARSITWDVKNASHSLKFTAASIVTFPAGTNTLLGSAVANSLSATLTLTSAYVDSVNGLGFRNRNGANDTNISTLDGSSGLRLSQNHEVSWGTGFSATGDRLVLGAQSGVSNTLVFGLWQGSATPFASRISGNFASGTNITGGTLNLGTQGTGTGTGGRINLQFHAAGASSSTLGTLVDVLSVVGVGTIRITSIPTSSAGLSTGDVYSNAGILTIV